MEPLTSIDSIRLTLRKAVENGHFRLEQLDDPSPGFKKNARPDRRTFPNGYGAFSTETSCVTLQAPLTAAQRGLSGSASPFTQTQFESEPKPPT